MLFGCLEQTSRPIHQISINIHRLLLFTAEQAASKPVKPDNLTSEGKSAWDIASKLDDVVRELEENGVDKVRPIGMYYLRDLKVLQQSS